MGIAHDRACTEAKAFCKLYPKFGYRWDDRNNRLKVGPRFDSGESAGGRDNAPSYHGAGRWVSDPYSLWKNEEDDTSKSTLLLPASAQTPRQLRLREEVGTALDCMKASQAEILQRHFIEGMTQQDIARELGTTQPAVSQRITTALNNFRTTVETLRGTHTRQGEDNDTTLSATA